MTDQKKAMASQKTQTIFEETESYKPESSVAKFWRKAKDAPFMPAGIAGGILSVLYGIYKYRHKGDMSTSIYLIHMRVAAQGAVVSALTVGVAYTLYRDYIAKPAEKHDETRSH